MKCYHSRSKPIQQATNINKLHQITADMHVFIMLINIFSTCLNRRPKRDLLGLGWLLVFERCGAVIARTQTHTDRQRHIAINPSQPAE